MAPDCRACGSPAVAFAVPEDLRAEAPEGAARAAICTRCLRTFPVDDAERSSGSEADSDPASESDSDPDFSAIHPAFPEGTGGVAFALACGLLGSLALNRSAIESLTARAEREGADVFLAFDRLSAADVDPHFDVDRRRIQLEQFL